LNERAVLALESGGTKLIAAIAAGDGRIIDFRQQSRPPQNRARDTLRQLLAMAIDIRSRFESTHRIVCAGFGFGGLVRRSGQSAYLCLHEDGWDEVDARQFLAEHLELPVWIENDCKVAALAEARCGAGQGAASMFYVTIGTGIGGGLVRNGKIVEGGDTGEGEIGHLLMVPHGPRCGCGARGCLEAVASGPGILALADGEFESTPKIFAAWERGDERACSIVYEAAGYMARGLASVAALIHPERIVLGGGVATGNPRYVALVTTLARKLTVSYFRPGFDLAVARLGQLVVPQGAALLAWDRWSEHCQ
jgi:glucokinase